MVGAHASSPAWAVVTGSGGMVIAAPAAIMVWNCSALIPPRTPTRRIRPPTVMLSRLNMTGEDGGLSGSVETRRNSRDGFGRHDCGLCDYFAKQTHERLAVSLVQRPPERGHQLKMPRQHVLQKLLRFGRKHDRHHPAILGVRHPLDEAVALERVDQS